MTQSYNLVMVRHGQSVWNEKNLFTGMKDVELTDKGRKEALNAGEALSKDGYKFDICFTSVLKRAIDTATIIKNEIGQSDLETKKDYALNERDYGDLVGRNKAEAAEQYGAEQVHKWRRSYDIPPPNGESLEMTAKRSIPYFEKEVMPYLKAGKRVLLVAHGNSIRSLVMKIENLTPEEILKRELETGVPIYYHINEKGEVDAFPTNA